MNCFVLKYTTKPSIIISTVIKSCYYLTTFLFVCSQAACEFLSEPMQGKDLLIALAKVTNMYYNGTGTAKCVNWKDSGSTPSLGYKGWAYQVGHTQSYYGESKKVTKACLAFEL